MNTQDEYSLVSVLGIGGCATVFRAVHQETDRVCAVKRIEKSMMDGCKVEREVNIMKGITCPFVVPFFGMREHQSHVDIIMGYCEGGNLGDFIQKRGRLDEATAKVMFAELIFALKHLHVVRKVLHRDIKAENILHDKNGHIRLSDFGLSCVLHADTEKLTQTYCGSPAYVPPEMIKRDAYTAKTDIWSSGVVLYLMLTGGLPFNGSNIQEMMRSVLEDEPVFPPYLSEKGRLFLTKLLSKDANKRPDIFQVLTDPWLTECPLFKKIQKVAECTERGSNFDPWVGEEYHEEKIKRELGILARPYQNAPTHVSSPQRAKVFSIISGGTPLACGRKSFGRSSPLLNPNGTRRRTCTLTFQRGHRYC